MVRRDISMQFVYEPALLEHMEKKGLNIIVVEMVEVSSSDLEISELHVQLVNEKRASFFCEKKDYRPVETEHGKVLLPRYPLTMEETVTFGLKKILFVPCVTHKGIKI